MNKNTIAAQLYTLRDFLKTPEDIKKTLKQVKDLGYNAVQLSGLGQIEPVMLKSFADENDLKICATHCPYNRFKDDLNNLIKEHKIYDCKFIGIGAMPQELRQNKDAYISFAKEFNEIGKRVSQEGLRFVYHNHRFEFESFNGRTGMDILFEETDSDAFGFLLDTYWVQAGGANPVDWIYKLKGRMDVIHLKDMAIKNDQQIITEVGNGNLNWNNIIKAARETEVSWFAVEQDTCPGNPFDSLKQSITYLERFL